MKRFIKKIVMLSALFALSACAGIPAKSTTPMASYNQLVVRSINWHDIAVDKISGDEEAEYKKAQPKLAGLFKAEFEKYISKTGYFEKITFSDEPVTSGALILEPRIVTLDPGIRWVMPGTANYMGKLTSGDGKTVAKYSAKRTVSRPIYSTMMGTLETLFTELGEDAATELPQAKP